MRVDIWSDVVCPWCYIGKRRFEKALTRLADEHDEFDVEVVFRPFQLDPTAPPGSATRVVDAYARKFGGYEQAQAMIDKVTAVAAEEGLEFHLDGAMRANTLLAHRLLWWATTDAVALTQAELKERLMQAYFTNGENVGDPDVLASIVAELGADGDAAARFLAGDGGLDEVDASLQEAAGEGITAVPTYVVDGAWSIPGAQDPDVFVKVLRKLADRTRVD